jgi:hypothetical protein
MRGFRLHVHNVCQVLVSSAHPVIALLCSHCCCRRSWLSPEQFRVHYEAANRPVVLTDAMGDWPALAKWDRQYLLAALAGRPVSCKGAGGGGGEMLAVAAQKH